MIRRDHISSPCFHHCPTEAFLQFICRPFSSRHYLLLVTGSSFPVMSYWNEPPNYVFSLFAFIGFLLCCIPLPWHLEAWNTGTCLYMIWTGLGCLNFFINSIVWNGNVLNWAPVWCDISSRYIVAVSVAIPCASLCINRRLYLIASIQSVTTTKAEKHRAVMVDLAIGVGIPVLQMILHYVVQGHRFNIFEDIGCFPFAYNTPPAYALEWCWPIVISCVSACYCVLTILTLAKRRAEFNQMLAGSAGLNSSRYLRLMGMASVEFCLGIPWATIVLYFNIHGSGASTSGVNPWISWENVHANFYYVGQFPAFEWKATHLAVITLELSRWSCVICAFIFFGFFGFAQEARKNYRLAFNSVAKKVGYTTIAFQSGMSSSFGTRSRGPTMSTTGRGAGTLPVFIRRETVAKHDSLASFSTSLNLGDVGGTLDDVKEPYSPTDSSSGSSRTSQDEKRESVYSPSQPPALARPEPVIAFGSQPRRSGDVPMTPRPDSATLV